MKKKIILLISIVLYSITTYATSLSTIADTVKCRCKFYSSYNRDKYIHKADSLHEMALKKYEEVFLIGCRSFSIANILVIGKTNNTYTGVFYDLTRRSHEIISGVRLKKMVNMFLTNSKYSQGLDSVKSVYIDHDYSWIVSFSRNDKMQEICVSQIMAIKGTTIAKMFSYYNETFSNVSN
jgi:hypothetical protein